MERLRSLKPQGMNFLSLSKDTIQQKEQAKFYQLPGLMLLWKKERAPSNRGVPCHCDDHVPFYSVLFLGGSLNTHNNCLLLLLSSFRTGCCIASCKVFEGPRVSLQGAWHEDSAWIQFLGLSHLSSLCKSGLGTL